MVPVLPFSGITRADRPARLRTAFEHLGGAWVKLGQMLAMRFDLLPAAFCTELFKLLNDVRPFAYERVREIVNDELGEPPEIAFREFAVQPFAAASIGQVHRATLHTGESVAVKVQRPRIREQLETDIALMYAVTGLLDWSHLFGATRSREVIDEFARWTADELDYLVEARQAVQLYAHASDEPYEKIARVYRAYTTSRVLTTEFLDGIHLIDIVSAKRAGNSTYLANLTARGYDLDRIVHHLDMNMLNGVYVFGYFHADLHPANLLVLPDNVIGYVDFGMVGQLPTDVRESLTRYSWLLFQSNVDPAVRELMRWLAPSYNTDINAARQQLVRVHQDFLYAISDLVSGAAAPEMARLPRGSDNPYSKLAMDIMQTMRRHQLTMSPSVVPYMRMLVALGALRHELASERYDLSTVVRRFFGGLVRGQVSQWFQPELMWGRIYDASYRLQRAMEFVEFIEAQQPVIAAASGTFLGVHGRLQAVGRRLMGLGAAALVVGVALYFVLSEPVATESALPREVPFPLVRGALLALGVILILVLMAHGRAISRER